MTEAIIIKILEIVGLIVVGLGSVLGGGWLGLRINRKMYLATVELQEQEVENKKKQTEKLQAEMDVARDEQQQKWVDEFQEVIKDQRSRIDMQAGQMDVMIKQRSEEMIRLGEMSVKVTKLEAANATQAVLIDALTTAKNTLELENKDLRCEVDKLKLQVLELQKENAELRSDG